MEPARYKSSFQPRQEWQRLYELVLHEPENHELFNRIEAAQTAILLRRDAVIYLMDEDGEEKKLAEALAHLRFLKKNRLGFSDPEEDDDY
jgi:hypothetical protein